MKQSPAPGEYLLKWRGDFIEVTLALPSPRKGRALLRTDIGGAKERRAEIIAEAEQDISPQSIGWRDIPLKEVSPGVFSSSIALDEIGVFSGKVCFFPEGVDVPEWPEGDNFRIKVQSSQTRANNSIYTVFPRQFGSFREVVRRLDHIMGNMGFRIIQTLPPFPVPTTYAVMGEYGCPFAATDFYSVDPAMAEFDSATTPLDQYEELIGAVHARGGLLFLDLPANHTGWGSTLQLHHPEWFKREADGKFKSPGAWGVVWEDLVELDYSHKELWHYMADVFLYWCRRGVDGFRCDAGYMIPEKVWAYIVSKVREEHPDTVFMLEGLGGDLAVTDNLLSRAGIDWAYSELFQTYDRGAFEWYLPQADTRAAKFGALVHFAETHDNSRLAEKGQTYARLRVILSSLLSWQGAWGITNGVEFFASEKIDVHGKNDLNWGATPNMVDLISRLNLILKNEPLFTGCSSVSPITRGDGNTLAVLKYKASSGNLPERKLLVLANLDCASSAEIDWDRNKFAHTEAFDLLTERKVSLAERVHLEPGQVMCLSASPAPAVEKRKESLEMAAFNIDLSSDFTRDVVIPAGVAVEVSDSGEFNLRVSCRKTNRTLSAVRSEKCRGRMFSPPYEGDGTHCAFYDVSAERYSGGSVKRVKFSLAVPPPWEKAAFQLQFEGAKVRKEPLWRSILSNGAGAVAQMRLGWGRIASQYDALLSANPDKEVPSDRINVWARMRCWLQCEGYVREFDEKYVTLFQADPAGRFAKWSFSVPCGMGRRADFVFTHRLVPGENTAGLTVERVSARGSSFSGKVRLVFRPDIEWRSFHTPMKAFLGAEKAFPAAVKKISDEHGEGFDFTPEKGAFSMRVKGGSYHSEPEWAYNIAHSEEAERGLDPSGDLFSPGWISADFAIGSSVEVIGAYLRQGEKFSSPLPAAEEERTALMPLEQALPEAMRLFIVKRNELKTVIAGYPWFLDWGRDTFIFMRGMIAAGMMKESVEILRAFAAFEENGTLPNIIYGSTAGNRDTTDAQLWFIRCVMEAEEKGIDASSLKFLKKTCRSIVENYIKGTPNSIRMDEESALVWSPSHFTWMDTNYPACTPREGYPVEIQALWISALKYLGLAELAKKALKSLKELFKTSCGYADCLSAPKGVSACNAVKDEAVRPNQLFLLTLGVVDDTSILRATEKLLIPGGMRSLSPVHPLYRGVYTGDENTSRKQSYHNGTAWMWPFPLYAESLFLTRSASRKEALSLLASAVENINAGCVCHMSEIADGDAPHSQKGCAAQAWSVSELFRVYLRLKEGQ